MDDQAGGPAVEAWDLTKRYGEEAAVLGVDLVVEPGTIFGFIGPSGSGKTTTVRLLTGAEPPTEGEVRVLGKPPSAFTPLERARMGYLPQLSVLYPHLSLWENLNFVASLYGLPLRRRARLREVLDLVELTEHRRKQLRHASGGMQRRLALAAALVHRPDVLFLDEPTVGIDPMLRRKFWGLFRQLAADGHTLFVTTQYVGEAVYCDRVGVLNTGRLLAVDSPDGLRRRAFGGDYVDVVVDAGAVEDTLRSLEQLELVRQVARRDGPGELRLLVQDGATAVAELPAWFAEHQQRLHSIQHREPSFDDVFVEIVQRQTEPTSVT